MDLRYTFNREALLYAKARPQYPTELFNKLIEVANLHAGDHLLEIGPGTGQATQPLAAKGYRITGVELGDHLAVVARHILRHYPNVDIITSAFETTELSAHAFQLVYSATAFHWIEPEVQFTKTHNLLVPRGYLAIIHTNHISDEQGEAFRQASQAIYDRYWPPSKDSRLPLPNDIEPAELDGHLFELAHFQVFPLTVRYTADEYADLLNTYSPTLALPEEQRHTFLNDIRRLINKTFDGHYSKQFIMSLTVARAL